MGASVLFLGSADSPTYEYLRSIHAEISTTSAPLDLESLERRPPDWIVSHGYRHIVPPEVVARFRDRMVNLHISLLPWNRGADPNLWSFVEGTPSGVTVHYMDEGVDTGDVIAQRELEDAVAIYDKGDFNAAIERLGSPGIAAGDTAVRVAAHKYSAFSYCVTRRTTLCRTQFEAALKLDPTFELSPAERGHPLWGPVYERVKKAQSAAAKK